MIEARQATKDPGRSLIATKIVHSADDINDDDSVDDDNNDDDGINDDINDGDGDDDNDNNNEATYEQNRNKNIRASSSSVHS